MPVNEQKLKIAHTLFSVRAEKNTTNSKQTKRNENENAVKSKTKEKWLISFETLRSKDDVGGTISFRGLVMVI